MTNSIIKAGLVAVTFLAGTTGVAVAGESHGLKQWASYAGDVLSEKMRYPGMAIRNGDEGSPKFRVTIDRDGDVETIKSVTLSRSVLINSAAKRALKRTDFPALPANYDGETLTFAVNMTYAIASNAQEARNLLREGHVSSRQLAGRKAPLVASIEILEDAD